MTRKNHKVADLGSFATRINPMTMGFSPKMAAIVGAIIGHDYGVKDRRGRRPTGISITSDGFVIASSTASDGGGVFIGGAGDLEQNLSIWKADQSEFETHYAKVTDWRKR